MVLTTPNLEKSIKAVVGVFSRNNANIKDWEREELKKLVSHTESSLKNNLGKFSLAENLVSLLMFHYTVYHGNPKTASEQLRSDIRLGKDLTLMKLHSSIVGKQREEILKDLNSQNASQERINLILDKLDSEYTIDDVLSSVIKTTHDLLTILNNHKDEFF